jgi:hypothetical protein
MPKTPKTTPSADKIAEKASRGENIFAYFSPTNSPWSNLSNE